VHLQIAQFNLWRGDLSAEIISAIANCRNETSGDLIAFNFYDTRAWTLENINEIETIAVKKFCETNFEANRAIFKTGKVRHYLNLKKKGIFPEIYCTEVEVRAKSSGS